MICNYDRTKKIRQIEAADDAHHKYYRTSSENEALQLLELIMPENPDAAIIERSARVHPLTEHKQC
jgi:hypothetical protein